MYILKLLIFLQTLFSNNLKSKYKPSPRTGPQDLLVTHYDCEENEQKTLHKYAINQVSQCETEPQAIETTELKATLYSKARATTVTVINSQQHFPKRKYIVHKSRTETKTDLTMNHSTKVI